MTQCEWLCLPPASIVGRLNRDEDLEIIDHRSALTVSHRLAFPSKNIDPKINLSGYLNEDRFIVSSLIRRRALTLVEESELIIAIPSGTKQLGPFCAAESHSRLCVLLIHGN